MQAVMTAVATLGLACMTLTAGGLALAYTQPIFWAAGATEVITAGGVSTNSLAGSSSLYLQQHAQSKVNWQPWGPEALEAARAQDKPIFLSIGYSSCHWCHVMERQTFSEEAVAAHLNEHFICIKVDREERPDLDDLYMAALIVYFQATGSNQSGGWPLSMFLTSEGKPFAGATFLPPHDTANQPGLLDVATKVTDFWANKRESLQHNASILAEETRRLVGPRLSLEVVPFGPSLVSAAVGAITSEIDPVHGGTDFSVESPSGAKFPNVPKLLFLEAILARGQVAGESETSHSADPETVTRLDLTLNTMRSRGLYDHLGGGFHRYSTDREWAVPHFEKMLYDQAMMAQLYLAGWQRTQNVAWQSTVRETLDFVLRELTTAQGGFAASIDAETLGEEGAYYVWSEDELSTQLTPAQMQLLASQLTQAKPAKIASGYVLVPPAGEARPEAEWIAIRDKLFAARRLRVRPRTDSKVVAGWNGLTIRALADAGRVLSEPRYVAAAEGAAVCLLAHLRDDRGRLLHSLNGNQTGTLAYLDDYAATIDGFLALERATGSDRWREAAIRLADDALGRFAVDGGGYFLTSDDHEACWARTQPVYDGVLPAGNSHFTNVLLTLAEMTGDPRYAIGAQASMKRFAAPLRNNPSGMAWTAWAVDRLLNQPQRAAGRSSTSNVVAAVNAPGTGAQIVRTAAVQVAKDGKAPVVKPRAYFSVDRLPPGETCQLAVVIDVAEGWHIQANPPSPETMIATTITLKSERGSKLTKVAYPKGHEMEIPDFDEPVSVYEGEVKILATVEVPADAAGKEEVLELSIKYQPCNDEACLPPKTIKLQGKIRIAAKGEQVQTIEKNQPLFEIVKEKPAKP